MRSWIVGIVTAVSLLGMNACWGAKPHHHPHDDRPDTGIPTGPDSYTSDTTDTVEVVSCQQIEELIAEGDYPSGPCAEDQPTCEEGIECCCGACAPNVVCQCYDGTWGCYFTDFCLRGSCPEGGLEAWDAG